MVYRKITREEDEGKTYNLEELKEREEDFLKQVDNRRKNQATRLRVQMEHTSPEDVKNEGLVGKDLPEMPVRVVYSPPKQSSSKCAPAYVLAAGSMTEKEFYRYKKKNKDRLTLAERAAMDLVENAVINEEEKDKDRFWNLSMKMYESMADRENKAIEAQSGLNIKPNALMNDIFSEIEKNLQKVSQAQEAEIVDAQDDAESAEIVEDQPSEPEAS